MLELTELLPPFGKEKAAFHDLGLRMPGNPDKGVGSLIHGESGRVFIYVLQHGSGEIVVAVNESQILFP